MPSPIAHGGVLLLVWPSVREQVRPLSMYRRACVLVILLFTLVAPDLDILLGLLFGSGPFVDHGGPTHSIIMGALLAVPIALILSFLMQRVSMARMWSVAFACYTSHVVLDAMTFGRGVMLGWPFTKTRIASPWPIFAGVRHSSPAAWLDHALTIATECLFVLLLWRIVHLARRRNHRRHATPRDSRTLTGDHHLAR